MILVQVLPNVATSVELGYRFRSKRGCMHLPLTGIPLNVITPLYDFTLKISKNRKVEEFYVGRTNNLVATKSRHGCEQIIPMYETSSTNNACIIEDALIKTFITHYKCSNNASHSGGCTSEDYINYVYIALWFK